MKGSGLRHLLFFAYYYPPLGGAGSLRAHSFARHLPHLGWRLTVVTPKEGVYGEDASLGDGGIPGATVVRTESMEPAVVLRKLRGRGPAAPEGGGGAYVEEARLGLFGSALRAAARKWLYFPDSARGWITSAVSAAETVHKGDPVDAVLSSSPPVSTHVAAMRFSRKARIPWVADWRDPWSAHLQEGDPGRRSAVALERKLLAAADGLVAATDGVAGLLAGVEPSAGPAVVVRNGFEEFPSPPVHRGEAGDPVEILHTGTVYGRSQDIGPLLAVLARSGGALPRPIRLRFVGKVDAYTRSAVADAGLGDVVEFAGFRTHAESLEAMTGADILLLLTWAVDSAAGRAICPAKMYEYLGSGRPILVLAPPSSEALGLLRGIPGVFHAPFHDEAAIERALHGALATVSPLPVRSLESVAQLTRERQAAILAEVLDRVAGGRRG